GRCNTSRVPAYDSALTILASPGAPRQGALQVRAPSRPASRPDHARLEQRSTSVASQSRSAATSSCRVPTSAINSAMVGLLMNRLSHPDHSNLRRHGEPRKLNQAPPALLAVGGGAS